MANDILTLALEGEVDLQEFASAISNFNLLISQLSREVGQNAKIEWIVEELHAGSAIATFRGVYADIEPIEKVVSAYEEIGDAIATGRDIPFSAIVKKHTAALTNIIDGRISAIRFETSE